MAGRPSTVSPSTVDFAAAYPNSRKVLVEGRGVQVPMREIALSGGEPSLRVYDTSGPQGVDVRQGLPPLRAPWIAARGQVEEVERSYRPLPGAPQPAEIPPSLNRRVLRGTGPVTQLHYARKGEITPEMEFIAVREGLDAEFVRVGGGARPRHHPGNINHPELEPMIIGRNFLVKINANIGNSAVSSSIDEEVDKLRWATLWGADTVMDLSTGEEHPRDARVDPPQLARADRDGADLPGAREGRREARRTSRGRSTATRSSSRPSRASTTSPCTRACCCATSR